MTRRKRAISILRHILPEKRDACRAWDAQPRHRLPEHARIHLVTGAGATPGYSFDEVWRFFEAFFEEACP